MRLIVCSNRLPVTLTKNSSQGWNYTMSSGGLVSALSGLKKEMQFTWIGWPGPLQDLTKEGEEEIERDLKEDHSCVPGLR